jgi:hypothetical protein
MASYKFSYVIKPSVGIAYTKHIVFAERETCIAISCDSSDGECTHLLEPSDNTSFVKALGADSKTSVLDAVAAAVLAGQESLIDQKVHAIVKPDFVWYDFDSPFYGDKYTESIRGEDGQWIVIN